MPFRSRKPGAADPGQVALTCADDGEVYPLLVRGLATGHSETDAVTTSFTVRSPR
jgi:hypothetical protein